LAEIEGCRNGNVGGGGEVGNVLVKSRDKNCYTFKKYHKLTLKKRIVKTEFVFQTRIYSYFSFIFFSENYNFSPKNKKFIKNETGKYIRNKPACPLPSGRPRRQLTYTIITPASLHHCAWCGSGRRGGVVS